MTRKRRRSAQDHFQDREQSDFVGRLEQISEYRNNLGFSAGDRRHRFFFNIYGDAGVGKTSLMERLRQLAVDNEYITAYVDQSLDDVVSALTITAGEFRRNGAPLGEFEKRAAVYHRLRNKIASDSDAPEGMASFLTKGLVQVGFSALRNTPVMGALAPIDPAAAGDQANRARAYVVQKFRDRRDRQLLLYPDSELTSAFVAGLNRIGKTRPIGLFIDGYERSAHILDDWLLGLYSGRYGALPETLITTVAGQKQLDPNIWHKYRTHISDISLHPFIEAEARQFLITRDITDERTIDVILKLSGRLPMWLATLAASHPADAEEIGDPAGSAVERFLQWEEDPERKSTALAGALPRKLNQEVLATITTPDKTSAMFDWLCGMPFVSPREASWAYHEVVRAAMLRLRRAQAPSQWRSDHMALAQANERWAREVAGQPPSATWDNPRWADYFREAMYHLLCADPVNNLDRVLATAEEAAAHSSARARQWAELLADAARDAEAPELTRYAQYLSDSIRSSELVLYSSDYPDDTQKSSKGKTLPPAWDDISMDGNVLRAMESVKNPREASITIWGPPQSGKTTLLAALGIALNRNGTGWNVIGAEGASEEALIRLTACLSSKKVFPKATTGIAHYRWILNGWASATRKQLFSTRQYRVPVRISLKLADASGDILYYDALGPDINQEFIANLSQSQGVLYVFDPTRERHHGDAFDITFGPLVQLASRTAAMAGHSGGRLPHYVAVCITKFDDPDVYTNADTMNLLTANPADPHGFPHVDEKDARKLFWRLCDVSRSGNAEMAFNALEQNFWPDRIKYFVTSAIGFYLKEGDDQFDPEDYQNCIPIEQEMGIRGPVYPINVAEPLLWLSKQISHF